MGQPIIPFLFRGMPKDIDQGKMLESVLINAGLDLSRIQALPQSIASRRYRADMDDKSVWELYPKHLIQSIGSIFARLLPVIPCSLGFGIEPQNSVDFLGQRLLNVDRDPQTAKHVVFLESREDVQIIKAQYPIATRSNQYLRRGMNGLLFAIPLFDAKEGRNVQGSFREFVQFSNRELEARYSSLTEESSRDRSPPPSQRK